MFGSLLKDILCDRLSVSNPHVYSGVYQLLKVMTKPPSRSRNQSFPMEPAQIIAKFARFDIEKMICEDPSEFWDAFLTRANLLDLFQVKRVIATRCENCFVITGINHNTCTLNMKVVNIT